MFKDNLLKNKTIVVTGGGSGLGKSMARRFGELGANLVISGRRKEVLEEAAHEFSEKNIDVLKCFQIIIHFFFDNPINIFGQEIHKSCTWGVLIQVK